MSTVINAIVVTVVCSTRCEQWCDADEPHSAALVVMATIHEHVLQGIPPQADMGRSGPYQHLLPLPPG